MLVPEWRKVAERPQGTVRARADRRRETDGQPGGWHRTDARSGRLCAVELRAAPRPDCEQDAGAGRGRRGRDRTDENPAEVRPGARPAPEGRPCAPAPPWPSGVWTPAPALLRSLSSRSRAAARSGCPGEGAGEGAPRRSRAQEIWPGQECARAAGPPDSASCSDFGVSFPGGERLTSSFLPGPLLPAGLAWLETRRLGTPCKAPPPTPTPGPLPLPRFGAIRAWPVVPWHPD